MNAVGKLKKRILVIDDEELLIRSMALLIEKSGFQVYTAKNASDAEVMIEEENFNLIICDIRMPGKNGVEIIKSIQGFLTSKKRQKVPIIFITGFADEKIEQEAKMLKPAGYLMKPFGIQELMQVIKENLAK